MSIIVYHPDTGTIVSLDDAIVVEIPDDLTSLEDMEWYCAQNIPTKKRMVEVDYAEETDVRPPT